MLYWAGSPPSSRLQFGLHLLQQALLKPHLHPELLTVLWQNPVHPLMVLSIHLQSFVYSNLTPSAKIGSLRRINERELSFSLADRRPAIQGHTPPVTFGLHQIIDSVEENLKKKKKNVILCLHKARWLGQAMPSRSCQCCTPSLHMPKVARYIGLL